MGKGNSKKIICVLALVTFVFASFAQKHDKEKYYQIRSMETGSWKFAPEFYYGLMHSKYSGAEAYWSWSLSNFGLHYRFKESKSNCRTIAPRRVVQIEEEIIVNKHVQHQIDSITPLVTEEIARALERNVDVVYPIYKEDFEQLGSSITEGITFAMEKSKGKLKELCDILQTEYETVCSQIEYIHKQGPGNEVESTKRQLVYEDAKEKLTNLAKASYNLAYYSTTF